LIADAEKGNFGIEQRPETSVEQQCFVLMRCAIGGEKALRRLVRFIVAAAEPGEIVDGGADAGDQLLHLVRFSHVWKESEAGRTLYG